MPSPELERLADLGHLKREPPTAGEFVGLVRSGLARLADAERDDLSPEGRFDLAYNPAHALALAALRWHGYRTSRRYLVFQTLGLTLNAAAATVRLLGRCHQLRNQAEYEGRSEVDQALLESLLEATRWLAGAVRALPLPPDPA